MKLPPTRVPLAILLIIDAVIWSILVSVGETPASYMGEGKAMTWLSAAHLLLSAALAGIVFWQSRKQAGSVALLGQSLAVWLIIAVGFVFLTVDELSQFHENLDKWVHAGFHLQRTHWSSRLDDFIILFYGLIGLGTLGYYRREFTEFHGFKPFLTAAFLVFFLMVAIDVASSRADIISALVPGEANYTPVMKWLNAIEEAAKVLAEALFAALFYHVLRQVPRLGNRHGHLSQ